MTDLKYESMKINGKRLSQARQKKGYTQEEFCEIIFTDEDTDEKPIQIDRYRKWECGKNEIPAYILKRMSTLLDCDIGYFFGEIDKPRKDVIDITEATGLSYESCSNILKYFGDGKYNSFDNLTPSDVMNILLSSDKFLSLIYDIAKATKIKKQLIYDFADISENYPTYIETENETVYNAALAFKFYEIYMDIIRESRKPLRENSYDKYDDELLDE